MGYPNWHLNEATFKPYLTDVFSINYYVSITSFHIANPIVHFADGSVIMSKNPTLVVLSRCITCRLFDVRRVKSLFPRLYSGQVVPPLLPGQP